MEIRSLTTLVVIPDHANILTKEGWTKKQLKEFIVKNASTRTNRGGALTEDDFTVVVAGGPGTWMGSYRSAGGFENSFVTRKIELPRDWKNLVAKYRDLVPTYEKY
jgi:hypothetical protein